MNKQLFKLLVESGLMHAMKHTDIDIDKEVEKFAELIVRECIKSTLSLCDTAIDNEWKLDETFHVVVDTIVEDLDMQHIFQRDNDDFC